MTKKIIQLILHIIQSRSIILSVIKNDRILEKTQWNKNVSPKFRIVVRSPDRKWIQLEIRSDSTGQLSSNPPIGAFGFGSDFGLRSRSRWIYLRVNNSKLFCRLQNDLVIHFHASTLENSTGLNVLLLLQNIGLVAWFEHCYAI